MKVYGIVYKFTNIKDNNSYIGITRKAISERLEGHWNRAKKERSHFQNALHLYGKEGFKCETLFSAYDRTSLIAAEIELIKSHKTLTPNGYNLTNGGDGMVNMTEEIRKKISISRKGKVVQSLVGKKLTPEATLKISRSMGSRPVKVESISTGEIFVLDYVTEGKKFGFNPSLISAVIYGKRNHHKGYKFSYISQANTEGNVEEISTLFVTHRGCEIKSITPPRASDNVKLKMYADLTGNCKK